MKLPLNRSLIKAVKTSWPLASLFLVTVAVLVVAFLTAHSYEKKTSENEISVSKIPPKEHLYAVNAQILAIDSTKREITAKSVGGDTWNKQWKLLITDKTTLSTLESFSKAKGQQLEARKTQTNQVDPEKIFEQNLTKLSLTDFKVGDIVYVSSGNDDLAQTEEVKDVAAILLQKI